MKRGFLHFLAFLLVGSLFGLLAITPCENACGQDCCPNGFVDFHFGLDIELPNPVTAPPVFQGDIRAFSFHPLSGTHVQKLDFLTNTLLL
jgi:hypothetical protein